MSFFCFTTFSNTINLGKVESKEVALRNLTTRVANGSTALYDAIVQVLESENNVTNSNKTIVIVTDGMDTSSRQNQATAKEKIQGFQSNERNRILFLGSNQNACLTAQTLGIPVTRAMTYGTEERNMRSVFRAVSGNTNRYRSLGTDGFTVEEREISVS